jgi:L-aminopeptidase/D-esterase-like protein
LGIPFEGTPGPLNAITDVKGVEVGYSTIIAGEGELKVGHGPIRTGVTAVFPRGKHSKEPVFGAWFPLNGNGEITGTTWIQESGFLEGPIMITNTHSIGTVQSAVLAWQLKHDMLFNSYSYPIVTETWDGWLNDINGLHIKENHVFEALDNAKSGPLEEGNVGGGTGMMCFEFKGGTGTSSRKLSEENGGYIIGALVQANFGRRYQFQPAGVPVGREITENAPWTEGKNLFDQSSSIIVVLATDVPLLPTQLKRLAKRAAIGVARTGGVAENNSGDIFIAFSTANAGAAKPEHGVSKIDMLSNDQLNPVFNAAILATEEAIINALIAAETMIGQSNHKAYALPHDRLKQVLKKYNRLVQK